MNVIEILEDKRRRMIDFFYYFGKKKMENFDKLQNNN